jgi:two-component system sensor histidine kinase EvgS
VRGGWRCTQIDPQLAPAHEVDGVRLRQIVFNLLSNAIKFTARAKYACSWRCCTGQRRRRATAVPGVTDTGMGIAPEQLQHLFAPFTQAGAYIQRDHGGTGLGLSISQRLAQMMQGELTLHSTLGEGTRAEVRLSLVEAGSEDAAALLAGGAGPRCCPPRCARHGCW